MGVEYAHYFTVSEPAWTGDAGVARRVHDVLARWELIAGAPEVYDVSGGRTKKHRAALDRIPDDTRNLLVRYPVVEGVPGVERIMGPSYFPADRISQRYFASVEVVVGDEWRVHPSNEHFFVDVDGPQKEASGAAGPVFAATAKGADAPHAQVVAEQAMVAPDGFTGVWRGALRLDCGKDLPAIAGKQQEVPCEAFLRDLEAAFGAPLVQIGHIY